MSALTAPLEELQVRTTPQPARPVLRQVVTSPMRVSRVVYVIFLTLVLGLGMVGVLLLNTSIQERQGVVDAAQTQADNLTFTNATLTAQAEQLRSSSDLATKAWAMGMRPNPNPAFIQLAANGKGGTILGQASRVTGQELTDQNYTDADTVAAQIDKTHAAAVASKQKAADAAQAAYKAKIAAAKQKAAAAKAAQAAAAKAAASSKASTTASSKASTTASSTGGH